MHRSFNICPGRFGLLGLWIVLTLGAAAPQASAGSLPASLPLNLPLYFEANRGQAPHEIQFLSRGFRQNVLVAPTEMLITLTKTETEASLFPERAVPKKRAALTRAVRMQFVGANPNAAVSGVGELPGKVNYLVGNDPAKWNTSIPTFTQVRVEKLYPGVDLLYYGNQQRIEYDFTIAPHIDPSVIALHFDGADKVTIDDRGDLVVQLGQSELRQPAPVLYQTVRGSRKEISGAYRLMDAQTVAFTIGEYDPSLPLVIDPILNYSTYFGGNGEDTAWSVKVDTNGIIYMAGETTSTAFVTNSPGAFQTNYNGGSGNGDAFVAKFNTNGSVIYFTYIGGAKEDGAFGLTLNDNGVVYVTGFTQSPNFPAGGPLVIKTNGTTSYVRINSTFNSTFNFFPADAFVAALEPSGSNLIYSVFLGGDADDAGVAIALDTVNNVYVTGYTSSTNFPVSTNSYDAFPPYQQTLKRSNDVFVTKIAFDGATIPYSTYFGGTNHDRGEAIVADASGNAFVTGYTFSPDFSRTPGVLANIYTNLYLAGTNRTLNNMLNAPNSGQFDDAFVAKFNTLAGGTNSLAFSTFLGGSNNDACFGIVLDASNNACVVGYSMSPDTTNAFNTITNLRSGGNNTNALNADVFLARISADGSTLLSALVFGGTANDIGFGLALDPIGNLFVVGHTFSVNFPTNYTSGYLRNFNSGGFDVFVTALNTNSSTPLYSAYLGGGLNDLGYGIAADQSGSVYIVGHTASSNFPQTNTPASSRKGPSDAFLAKISLPPSLILSLTATETNAVTLSWPFYPEYAQFSLQSNTNLESPATWTNVLQVPLVTNNLRLLTLGATNNAMFFRLRQN